MTENYIDEIWKDIPEYEGLYQISNYGRVKSLPRSTTSGKIMKQKTVCGGYKQICLSKNNKNKFFLIHRLVAQAFLPNPNNLPDVNHKDEDKSNNCASNLEWCDKKYNCNYGTRNERIVEKQSKQVFQYDKDLNLIKVWDSVSQCSRNGFTISGVSKCCNGKRNFHKGFIWRYKNGIE